MGKEIDIKSGGVAEVEPRDDSPTDTFLPPHGTGPSPVARRRRVRRPSQSVARDPSTRLAPGDGAKSTQVQA